MTGRRAPDNKRLKPCGTVAAYKRHQRNGEPTCAACRRAHADHRRRPGAEARKVSSRSRPIAERFWEKVNTGQPDQCWEWRGSRRPDGYGQLGGGPELGARPFVAHRVSFWLVHGFLPPVVMHACDNRPCVNPAHLRAGTYALNNQDRADKGRSAPKKGSRMPHGAQARYTYGCRCAECRAANAATARLARARRALRRAS